MHELHKETILKWIINVPLKNSNHVILLRMKQKLPVQCSFTQKILEDTGKYGGFPLLLAMW